MLFKQVLDSDVGPSSSSASTVTPPNGRNGRMLTPASDDGEYVEYSFDSVSEMPYTEEDEDRVSYTVAFFGVAVIVSYLSCLYFLKTFKSSTQKSIPKHVIGKTREDLELGSWLSGRVQIVSLELKLVLGDKRTYFLYLNLIC